MDVYVIVKYLHVLFIIIWLGGGFGLVILGMRAERAKNDAELARVIQNVIFMANSVFIPAALAALACGITMVLMVWSFAQLWILIGLGGFALTFGIGLTVLKPRSDRLGEQIAREGVTPAVGDQARQILWIAQFDFVMLFVIVADMIFKPAPGDYILLIIMAAAIAAGAYFFLGKLRTATPASAGARS